jgi:hypothetical protein
MSSDPEDWLFPSRCNTPVAPRNDTTTPARPSGQRAIPLGPLTPPSLRRSSAEDTRSTSMDLDAGALDDAQDLFSMDINGIALKMLLEVFFSDNLYFHWLGVYAPEQKMTYLGLVVLVICSYLDEGAPYRVTEMSPDPSPPV